MLFHDLLEVGRRLKIVCAVKSSSKEKSSYVFPSFMLLQIYKENVITEQIEHFTGFGLV